MDNVSPTELLAQAGDDAGEALESFMRTAARTAFMNVMLVGAGSGLNIQH